MKSFFQHEAVTDNITVRVAVSYLSDQSRSSDMQWVWSYHIRIENGGDQIVQLMTRHWVITDGRGGVQHVNGDGVVGEQPVLVPGQSHDYVSGCPLNTPSGKMEGSFQMLRGDGVMLDVAIPCFPLVTPATAT